MATINEQVDKQRLQIASNLALINGLRPVSWLHVFFGDGIKYGCFVSSPDANTLHVDDSDVATKNPNMITPSLRSEDYPNVALVYGEVYYSDYPESNPYVINMDQANYPSATYSRNDIIYVYVGDSGPNVGQASGAAVTGVPVDPSVPVGGVPIARVVVDDTGITSVVDLRVLI